jgi:hypothetical protein
VTAVIVHASKTAHSSVMTRPISMLTHGAAALLISAVGLSAGNPVASATNGATRVPLRTILRTCDFTQIYSGSNQSDASATSQIRVSGGTVAADAQLSNPNAPGTHYDVSLIQAPRASNAPCTSAGPGVAVGGLDSDGAGQASTTVQDSIRSGTTGVWVLIQRPGQNSQAPAEVYTSDFIAPV